MSGAPPKSAVELVMERLRQKDAESGVKATPLTNTQIETIAEARRICEARIAECRILHDAALLTILEPEALQELEANYRRDLARFASDRDRKIDTTRKGVE